MVLRRGEPPATVRARGEWEADALLRELRAYARPALLPLRSADAIAAFRAGSRVSVVANLQARPPRVRRRATASAGAIGARSCFTITRMTLVKMSGDAFQPNGSAADRM